MVVSRTTGMVAEGARPRVNRGWHAIGVVRRCALRVSSSSSDGVLRVRVGGRTAGSEWFAVNAVVERIEVQLVETVIDFVLDTIVVTVAVCEWH